MKEYPEPFSVFVKPVEASGHGTHPDETLIILTERYNVIIGKAAGITRLVPEYPEFFPVVQVQAILGSKPHESVTVPKHAVDAALRKSFISAQAVETQWLLCPGT
jgi:hypothetical protein